MTLASALFHAAPSASILAASFHGASISAASVLAAQISAASVSPKSSAACGEELENPDSRFAACGVDTEDSGESAVENAYLEMVEGSEILLGREQLHYVSKPAYPRVCCLKDGGYLLAYQETIPGRSDDNGRFINYAFSENLRDWTPMGRLFDCREVKNVYGQVSTRMYSCPEFCVLESGEVLAVCCFWNLSTYSKIEGRADNGIAIRHSIDGGRTWSKESEIFLGQSWEPFLIAQADGRIQCYFSEARAWIGSANSGTSMVESTDGGVTWTPDPGKRPLRVMRKRYWNPVWERYQYTDQMPTGVVIDNESGKMAFAMEDVDMGSYSLGIVFSPDDGRWNPLKGAEVGPAERIDSLSVNATGPYMVKFRSGEVLVTFTRNKGMEWPLLYRVGSHDAKSFGPERKAFDRGGWASAIIDRDDSVILVAPFRGGKLHIARFRLVKP